MNKNIIKILEDEESDGTPEGKGWAAIEKERGYKTPVASKS